MKCWGGNARGSLGLGDVVNRGVGPGEMGIILPPVALAFGDAGGDVSNVFAGSYHTCVSGTEGGLACFGINNGGQLGAETDDTALGDEPDEVESVSSIDLGSDVVVAAVPVPGDGVLVETISRVLQAGPTPAPVFTIPELSPTPVPTPMSVSIGCSSTINYKLGSYFLGVGFRGGPLSSGYRSIVLCCLFVGVSCR